jgi:hypothetical protein
MVPRQSARAISMGAWRYGLVALALEAVGMVKTGFETEIGCRPRGTNPHCQCGRARTQRDRNTPNLVYVGMMIVALVSSSGTFRRQVARRGRPAVRLLPT